MKLSRAGWLFCALVILAGCNPLPIPPKPQTVLQFHVSIPQVIATNTPYWDQRLTALLITTKTPYVSPDQRYWRLSAARWFDESESGGRHHIYFDAIDESDKRDTSVNVKVINGGSISMMCEAKPGEPCANFPMYGLLGSYSASVDDPGNIPSVVVSGLGMGTIEDRHHAVHTSFMLTFTLSVMQ